MKQVSEAELKEVYKGLGMPYDYKSKSVEEVFTTETSQKDEGVEADSDGADTAQGEDGLGNDSETDTRSKAK